MLLLLTAAIWGIAFVAQSVGGDYVGPFTFNAVRFMLGGTVLLPVLLWKKKAEAGNEKKPGSLKKALPGGICCGCALGTASILQQMGIQYTTVAKAGFLTALYIIIVPMMGILFQKKVRKIVWAAALLAVSGMYLLCGSGTMSVNRGDFLVFLSSLIFSVHILVIDHFSPKADGVLLSCIQFYTSSILCGIGMLFFESFSWQALLSGWQPVVYAGVLSCGIGYTLQIIGQKDMDPVVASLILSLESVISLIAGWIILGQALNGKEICGCLIVFAAILLVQLPEKKNV